MLKTLLRAGIVPVRARRLSNQLKWKPAIFQKPQKMPPLVKTPQSLIAVELLSIVKFCWRFLPLPIGVVFI